MKAPRIEKLTFNRPQTNFTLNLSKMRDSRNVWGRGTGKSFIIAYLMRTIMQVMPRSTWSIQGASYQQLLTRTLPGTFEALELLGFEKDKDYFINRQPDKGATLPYYRPLKYENYITLRRPDGYCVGFNLLSQDRTSSRGTNTDGIICDESLLLDIEEFNKQATFTNRGHDHYFGHLPMHHGVFHFSSMPTGDSFLFKNEAYYLKKGIDISGLRNRLIDLQFEFCKNKNVKDRVAIYGEMLPMMDQLKYYVSNGRYYSEWNIFDNLENLGLRYIDDMYDTTTEHIFLVEGLNKRVNKVVNGFYPTFSRDIHGYKGNFDYNFLDNFEFDLERIASVDSRQDNDCLPNLPLHVGLDFGTAINWLIVGQELQSVNEFNFIKDFYVKYPKIIDHLAQDFIEYYKHHQKKLIYLYPDAEGNWRRPNKDETFVETFVKLFKAAGWQVIVDNKKKYNKLQNETHLLWARLLLGKDRALPKIGFNLINCKHLVYSMEQAPAFDHGGQIKKNKESEKKLTYDREKATDASDAADQIIYYKYNRFLKSAYNSLPSILLN